MNKKAFYTLEFDKIIQMLAQHADSLPARKMCENIKPQTNVSTIMQYQQQTQDALNRLLRFDTTSFGNNKDFSYQCKHLGAGGDLNAIELLSIAKFLENIARVKQYARLCEEETDSLTELFDILLPLTNVSTEIRRCILSEEEIADEASPELSHIRHKMHSIDEKIHAQINQLLNGSARNYLMDAVITMRDNRYCLPVKAEYKNQVPGLIHDQSATGATLFIEPVASVELNNKLRELESMEKEEIEKIMHEISTLCMPYSDTILQNYKYMTRLDFIFAKGKLALLQNATKPIYQPNGSINIRKGRHPLLDKNKVVPIDIKLGDSFEQLIITGPNTGGKTVSLKTVGLFCLMGQSGLHIPAGDRSELRIFHQIYADIGDEQSIEQSLSTFSSHMKNIIYMLNNADQQSLCLFDELCSGTDPVEGAALAIAILLELKKRHTTTMATTHYSELKLFALSTEGVENASCEFDIATLSPTYRLLIGIPGKSNAFAISQKLGLQTGIIDKAKEQLSTTSESFEDVIANLETSRQTIEKEQLELNIYKKEIETLKQQLMQKQEKVNATRESILQKANAEARDILQEAKDLADETIRDFNKYGSTLSMKELEKKRQNVGSKISDKNKKLAIKSQKPSGKVLTKETAKPGEKVHVHSMGIDGIISSRPDNKGFLFVQCGIIKSKVSLKDLSLKAEDEIKAPTLVRSSQSKIKISKSANISPEINLLGMTCDEAVAVLDKYLDDAYISHLTTVRIVHGKGTGALRSAVASHLKRLSYISSYRLGEFGEGDAGVTIAEFK